MVEVIHAALECSPFVKIGGVADAVAGLADALVRSGHSVTVALPRRQAPFPTGAEFDVAALDVEGFEQGDPYGHEVDLTGEQARRFGPLAMAIVDLCLARGRAGAPVDVLHLHDWPVALVAYLARTVERDVPMPRTLLTIHNAEFQGIFPRHAATHFGLAGADAAALCHDGRLNALAAGIAAADVITTVSPTYAREMVSAELGFGLYPTFRRHRRTVYGILNGIDTQRWNPATDAALIARYDADDLSGRVRCKAALIDELGLTGDVSRPLVASVARAFHEKGTDLLVDAIPSLVDRGLRIVIAGAGDPHYEQKIAQAAANAPGRVVYLGHAAEARVSQLLSAADLVVVPSRRESCGLVQMYAQRYGAVPVAHRTGGLNDTIDDPATGFLFDAPNTEALLRAMDRAVAAMSRDWIARQRRCMRLDRSWDHAAALYGEIYNVLALYKSPSGPEIHGHEPIRWRGRPSGESTHRSLVQSIVATWMRGGANR